MSAFWEFLAGPVGSFLRVFVSVLLTLWALDVAEVGVHFDPAEWGLWVGAALGSALPVLVAWLNPADTRFGR